MAGVEGGRVGGWMVMSGMHARHATARGLGGSGAHEQVVFGASGDDELQRHAESKRVRGFGVVKQFATRLSQVGTLVQVRNRARGMC